MEELKYNAKIAVMRILKDIVTADSVIHEKEVSYMNKVATYFNLTDDYKTEVNNLVTLQALAIIRELDSSTKSEIAKLMGNMIIVDEHIDYNEVKLYYVVCESCNIEKAFQVEDCSEYSLSGPFMNPEDIMNNINF